MLLKCDDPKHTVVSIYFFDINKEESSVETDGYVYFSDSKTFNALIERTYIENVKECIKKIKRK
jgi:hypothetical protein